MEEKLVKAAGRRRKDIQFLVVSEKGRDKINPAGNSLAERIYTKEVDRLSSKVLSDQRTKLVHKTMIDRLIATKKKACALVLPLHGAACIQSHAVHRNISIEQKAGRASPRLEIVGRIPGETDGGGSIFPCQI